MSISEIGKPKLMNLRLESVRTDLGTQMRPRLNPQVVEEYRERLEDGESLGSLKVFHDGQMYILVDGFHRLEAYRRLGKYEVPCEVHHGSLREAILESTGVNQNHGLKRDTETLENAVRVLLEDPEWKDWSKREMARQVGCSHSFVSKYVARLTGSESSETTYTNRHGGTSTMRTGNIAESNRSRRTKAEEEKILEEYRQPKHKTEDDGPSLEYLESTASKPLSVEALTGQLADWMRGYLGENAEPVEMRETLERVANPKDRLFATFKTFLDDNRKMAEPKDIQEAAGLVLKRVQDAYIDDANESTTSLHTQGKQSGTEPSRMHEVWVSNELPAELREVALQAANALPVALLEMHRAKAATQDEALLYYFNALERRDFTAMMATLALAWAEGWELFGPKGSPLGVKTPDPETTAVMKKLTPKIKEKPVQSIQPLPCDILRSWLEANYEPTNLAGRKLALEHLISDTADSDAWWVLLSEHVQKNQLGAIAIDDVKAHASELLVRLTEATSKPKAKRQSPKAEAGQPAKADSYISLRDLGAKLREFLEANWERPMRNIILSDLRERNSEQMPKLKAFLKDVKYRPSELKQALSNTQDAYTVREPNKTPPKLYDPERVKGKEAS